jgi:hypothetical protein
MSILIILGESESEVARFKSSIFDSDSGSEVKVFNTSACVQYIMNMHPSILRAFCHRSAVRWNARKMSPSNIWQRLDRLGWEPCYQGNSKG